MFQTTFLNERSFFNVCRLCSDRGGNSNRGMFYSGLTLNQYGVASPYRTICTVCGFVALS